MAEHPHEAVVHHGHPGASTYVKLAVVLGVITLLEVGTYYIGGVDQYILILALIVLSAIKFALVVGYYMHLKFDGRVLTGIFVWGLFVAASVILAMMLMNAAF